MTDEKRRRETKRQSVEKRAAEPNESTTCTEHSISEIDEQGGGRETTCLTSCATISIPDVDARKEKQPVQVRRGDVTGRKRGEIGRNPQEKCRKSEKRAEAQPKSRKGRRNSQKTQKTVRRPEKFVENQRKPEKT
jgi:hypothetical protein